MGGGDVLGFQAPSSLGSRWMSAATGDWPGWPPVRVARQPEHQVWGESTTLVSIISHPGQVRWKLKMGIVLSLTEGTPRLALFSWLSSWVWRGCA